MTELAKELEALAKTYRGESAQAWMDRVSRKIPKILAAADARKLERPGT